MQESMKHLFMCLIMLSFFFVACDERSVDKSDNNSEKGNAYDGDGFEAVVLRFSISERKTNIELRNGYDKPVREIRGYLYFSDKEGEAITYANGSLKREPFQRVENPFIVDTKSTKRIKFSNQIDRNADKVNVVITEIRFTDGSRELFDGVN